MASSNSDVSMNTSRLTTASGEPLCIYALGGAARSVQPSSLPLKYRDDSSTIHIDIQHFYIFHRHQLIYSRSRRCIYCVWWK
jgi:hypothetical protein